MPVRATDRFVEEPLQIDAEPDIAAVGFAPTVITTLLLFVQPVAVIFSVKVYVVVTVGVTDGLADVDVNPEGFDIQL